MPKGYWMVHVTVEDAERYATYLALDDKVIKKFGVKPLVRGGRYTAPEGPQHLRHVIFEFESYEQALACYNSPDYQAALPHRLSASKSDIVIVEGVA